MSDIRDLVRIVSERQCQLDESDGEFARRLGISRQTWQLTRTGGMLPGRRTLAGIAVAFPELNLNAFLLPRNARILTHPASELTDIP